MSGIYLDPEPAAEFSPIWWEEAAALVKEISVNLHSLISQFERTLAYRTPDASTYDVNALKTATAFLIMAKRDLFPLIRWVANAKELEISEITQSEETALNSFCRKIDGFTDVKNGEFISPFLRAIIPVTGRSAMLDEQARKDIAQQATYLLRCFKDAQEKFLRESY